MLAESRATVGDRDGGVSVRLGRRSRLAATILLAVGAALLLAVALTSWGLISAVATLIAAAFVVGALFLARQAALWTSTRLSVLPGAYPPLPDQLAAAESSKAAVSPTAEGASISSPPTAIVGPPRLLSPPKPGAPIKRRLGAVVVPVHLDSSEQRASQTPTPGDGDNTGPGDVDDNVPRPGDNSTPGGGALIVHARADAEALRDGDRVLVWHLGRYGIEQRDTEQGSINQGGTERGGIEKPAVTGRFVLLRESDGQAFVATTRLTDTW